MSGLGEWAAQWRETYEAHPVATVVTWGELLAAVGLFVLTFVYVATADTAPTWIGVLLIAVGGGFAVWFVSLRRPVMERLVEE